MTTPPQSKPAPKAYFTRGYVFSASHRLHSGALSAEENRATFGKCNNPYGHGHNYRIEITVGGPIAAETGMVVNMSTLDKIVADSILARFDLSAISRYFPEFERELPRYLKALK